MKKLAIASESSFCFGVCGHLLEEMGGLHSGGACMKCDMLKIIMVISIPLASEEFEHGTLEKVCSVAFGKRYMGDNTPSIYY